MTSGTATEITTEMTDAELMDRLRQLARQRAPRAAHGGLNEEMLTEWIAADRIASFLNAIVKMKDLAAEAYAKEFPLSGGDVANCLAEAGMLTREEFIELVEKHDVDAAAALRAEPPPLNKDDDNSEWDRIPF
jgi:hypothetical protein